MKPPISTNFISKCKNEKFKTYGVFDKEADEFVAGTESVNLEEVNQWALNLNLEEDEKQLNLKKP